MGCKISSASLNTVSIEKSINTKSTQATQSLSEMISEYKRLMLENQHQEASSSSIPKIVEKKKLLNTSIMMNVERAPSRTQTFSSVKGAPTLINMRDTHFGLHSFISSSKLETQKRIEARRSLNQISEEEENSKPQGADVSKITVKK